MAALNFVNAIAESKLAVDTKNDEAVCRMLQTAIRKILAKVEPYFDKGYLADKLTEHSVLITEAQGLELLRKRCYIFRDELTDS